MFDYYAFLDSTKQLTEDGSLSSEFVDYYTVEYFRRDKKKEVRSNYIQKAPKDVLNISEDLRFTPNLADLPDLNWLGFEISFTLKTPWYSKDDRIFHVLDNPIRKDRVFGVPYQSAASWKGLLRWACRMESGLIEHLNKSDMKFEDWNDCEWILYLFGNEKKQQEDLNRGSLIFYPTFFNKIGFEVINPHKRKNRAGIKPIYYEVVPPETKGKLQLLYVPAPEIAKRKDIDVYEALCFVLAAAEKLITTYGISAKRTSGWGTAEINEWKVFEVGKKPEKIESFDQFKEQLKGIFETRQRGEVNGK